MSEMHCRTPDELGKEVVRIMWEGGCIACPAEGWEVRG